LSHNLGNSGHTCTERHFANGFLPLSVAKKQEEVSAFDYDAKEQADQHIVPKQKELFYANSAAYTFVINTWVNSKTQSR
jgi:hypothetical protein